MATIAIKNIGIIFNNRDLKADFNIIEIPQPPTQFKTNNTIEALPDGTNRQITTINPANDFTIIFAGETVKQDTIDLYNKMVNDELIDTLTIFSLEDGRVLGSWAAVIKDIMYLGAITNGAGNNGSIVFNLASI